MKNGTIYIDYRENNYFLSATIQNDTTANGKNIAEEIFSAHIPIFYTAKTKDCYMKSKTHFIS